MKKIVIFTFLFLLVSTPYTQADLGFYTGSGQNLRQITTEEIKLVSIDVSIVPVCGEFDYTKFSGGNKVEYDCIFVLQNLTDEVKKTQVGFPIDSQFANKKPTSGDWATEYGFIARDTNTTYNVEFVQHDDKEKKFSKIFTWEMKFNPNETKTITIKYHFPFSMSLATTDKEMIEKKYDQKDEKKWMLDVVICFWHCFGYITETGASWAGNVDKGSFKVITEPFEKWFNNRDRSGGGRYRVIRRPWWFREVSPEGWVPIKNGISWEYKNFKPQEPIFIYYYVSNLPRFSKDVDSFLNLLNSTSRLNREDLITIKEIILATYGKEPVDISAKKFVEDQIWYQPLKNFSLETLSLEQQEIIKEFERKIKK